jgi:Spy/CpxP family protein refolding chaperone
MDNLSKQIEEARDKMHKLIESNKPYSEIVKASQELDILIVKEMEIRLGR